MKNWILFFVTAFLFFSGCQEEEFITPTNQLAMASSDQNVVYVGEEFAMVIGKTVMVWPDGFIISFMDVPEDSRCPAGVDCIWEGKAVIKLFVQDRNLAYEVFLETPNSQQDNGTSINLFGRTVKLIEVAPYPYDNYPIALKQYRVVMIVDEMEKLNNGQ